MRYPDHGQHDATRRHAIVTVTLGAAAALVLAVLDDPAGGRARPAAPGTASPASQLQYRGYDAAASPVAAAQGLRPAVAAGRAPRLAHKQ